MIKTLAKCIGKYKKESIITPIFTAVEVFLEILIPFITASIIDKGIQAGDMRKVGIYGGIMLIIAFLSLFCGIQANRLVAAASTGFACNLREKMYENIQTFSFSNIDKFSTAGLVTRMTTDVTNVQNAYQNIIRSVVRAPLMMICSITMCVIISPRLSIIFLVALIFLGFVLFFIIYKVTPVFTSGFEKYDELNASVQENISGIRVVKAFVREEHENKKFNKAADNLYKTFVKAESFLAFNNPTMMLVVYGCIVALSWFASHFIVSGSITTGNLTSMFSYVMNMLMALMILSMIFVMVSMSAASARRISEVLNEKADLANPEKPYEEVEDGRIDFNHVNFSYRKNSTEDTLHDIDIHINAGETIGIIGGTGCGKSSFVSLISRLYDVTEGSVCVGGKDVRTYDMDALRNQVAVVLQKNVLFSGTILDNLRWGDDNASYEDCVEACKQACADEFIERMPKKYDTWIEQGGTNVSGGQRQRLCIARALLKKPKVLILDDSTSAVDTATDAKIKQAFAQKIPGTTKLIVSQRISSIQDADRIIVLEDGKVSGFDTHENLMENNKVYREICEVQMQGGGDFDESAE
ncbi:ABC transporter ATP-binding protein [Agathobacter rectalis]|jgi:ATP-binding cassette subfamily B multidrug efflux pump|uniref:ABC transporter ATP-binding protein n=1 Tax=Agathobacter rectalis TaxID=39491 RepID=A0A414ZM89_9FIRM|nr:ABC transporter ATP-binding protein [Agathobacter rectalis]RHI23610.1 ABC transporter ATP-binding protein [Agathobacter rectalis]